MTTIVLNKKGKLEKLTRYFMSTNADYFVYCQFIKDIEQINTFSTNSKQNLSSIIKFCLRHFTDSFIIKLSKLTEATIKLGNATLPQISDKNVVKRELDNTKQELEKELKNSNLKTIRDKIVAHLDDDFLNEKETLTTVNRDYLLSQNEEYQKLLTLTGELINKLWSAKCQIEMIYPKRHLNLANQFIPIIISGYKNFHLANKSIRPNEFVDQKLEGFTLPAEKKAKKLNEYLKSTQ